MCSQAKKGLAGLTKARLAMFTGDTMRLMDRDQRSQEAYVAEMQKGLKPEEEVQLSVDSPVTTNYCYPQVVPVAPAPARSSNLGLWLFLSVLAVLGTVFTVAVLGIGSYLYLRTLPPAPAGTSPPAASSGSDYIEFYGP